VSTAKALAEGKGYRLINYPGSPAQTKYPILYPMLLALIWKVWPNFPQNIFVMKLLSLVIGALAIGISYLYLVRYNYCPRSVAFTSCLICGTTPSFLFFSTNTLSEIPFLLLILFSLWTLEREIRTPFRSRVHNFLTGILLGLPFLCRSIGLVFVFSVIVFCYYKRIRMRLLILGAATVITPWVIWISFSLATTNYDSITAYYVDYVGWWSNYGFSSIIFIFFMNIFLVVIGISRSSLEGFYDLLSGQNLEIVGLIISLFLGWVFLCNYWREFREDKLVWWFLLAYFLMIFCWPWPPARFLIPILPFLIAGLMHGANQISQRFAPHFYYQALSSCVIAFLILSNLFILYQHIIIQNRTAFPQLLSKDASVYWTSYEDIFRWVKEYSSPNDIIGSGLDSMVFVYTEVQSFRPFVANTSSLFYNGKSPALGTVGQFRDILGIYKPKYLIHTPMPSFSEEKYFDALLQEFLNRYPNSLLPVYVGRDTRFKVYEINFD
jgi:hypothetical protein